MRRAVLVAMCLLIPAYGGAQDLVRRQASTVDAAAVPRAVEPAASDPAIASRFEEIGVRLRQLQQRVREDTRLQQTATALGIGAAAFATLRGGRSITGASTQALRLGLAKPLSHIRRRSGFSVEPTIGYRTLSITITRTFP